MADTKELASQPRLNVPNRASLLYDTRFLVALFLLGLGIALAGAWQLATSNNGRLALGKSLPGNSGSLPLLEALPLAIAGLVVLALLAGTIGGRRAYRRPALAAVVTLVLVATGINIIAPPGLQRIPGEVNDALQGVTARPEAGYPRIKVARVAIDLRLVKGDGRTPPVRYEAFTYPGTDHLLTGVPGGGNSYVYAHARRDMFGRLHDLRVGDVIVVDYGGRKALHYGVSEIHPGVNWKDFSWLQPSSDDRLTLQTCNGWQDEDPRFIVVARRIPDSIA